MSATTTVRFDSDIIREFLALPKTALPSAYYTSGEEGGFATLLPSAWQALRASLRPDAIHWDMSIRLRADADGWRDGVIVHV